MATPSSERNEGRGIKDDEYGEGQEEGDALLSSATTAAASSTSLPRQGHITPLGKARAYWLGCVVCMSGFLFGYDTGIIGGVLTLPSFQRSFYMDESNLTVTSSLAVSLQQAGALISCFLTWPLTRAVGRKVPLLFSALIFTIGATLQSLDTHSLSMFHLARFVAGLGLGGATVVVPMFSSEMAPPDMRGRIGCFFQLFFTFGIFTSYWTDYAVQVGIDGSLARQWQIPVFLQVVPAVLMGAGVTTLKESVRWFVMKGRMDEAWESLTWIRASDGVGVRREMEEIRVGVEMEAREQRGFRISELFRPNNFKLISTSFLVFLAQQATGATAFAYFGPQYFSLLAGDSVTRNLLLTGLFGAVKIVSCGLFVIFLSERFGRRPSFIFGAALMATIFLATAAVVATHPPPPSPEVAESTPMTTVAKTTVALIYAFVAVYNITWGPLPWPYVSEIFPARIREPGVATGVASHWLFNFVFTLTTPYMISNLGSGTFVLWGLFNVAIAVCSWLFIVETKGMSLEEINERLAGRKGALGRKVRDSFDGRRTVDRRPRDGRERDVSGDPEGAQELRPA